MTQGQSTIHNVALISGEDSDTTKSTTARHSIRPTLAALHGTCNYYLVERPDPERQRIGEGETLKLTPEQFPELLKFTAKDRVMKRASVTEIGAGQSDKSLARLAEFAGAHAAFDLTVMTIRPGQKVDKIIETIASYIALGFDPSKLALTYNLLEPGKTAADMWASHAFATLAAHANKWGYRLIKNGIPSSDAIRKLRELPEFTIGSLARGDVDFEAKAAELWSKGEDKKGDDMFDLRLLAMGSTSVVSHIDRMVRELFGLDDSFTLAA